MIHIEINTEVIKASSNDELTPKIVQYKGKRYCIRLEDMYWAVLEAEAKARGCKLNEIVHEYYTHPDAELNKTAFLRRHTVEWLAQSLSERQDELELDQGEVLCVLRATLRPAFIFSEDLSISQHNQSFRDWLGGETNIYDQERLDKLRVSFRASSRVLMQRITQKGGFVRAEPAAVLIPGFALAVKLDIVSVRNYGGKSAYLCKVITDVSFGQAPHE